MGYSSNKKEKKVVVNEDTPLHSEMVPLLSPAAKKLIEENDVVELRQVHNEN